MFTKAKVVAGVAVLTFWGTIAVAQQQTENSDQVPLSARSGSSTGSGAGAAAAGRDNQQSSSGLASAMANFMVRTGLVLGSDDQGRLVVEHIRPESDAARLGIKPGDVLSSVNGAETPTMRSLQQYLTGHKNQTAFSIGMGRGTKSFNEPMGRQMTLMGMTIFPDSADRPSVYRVQPGSPAAKAGVKKGDVVTSVGHQTTDTMTKFMNMTIPLVKALNPGGGIPFGVMRNGNPVKVSIARPSDSDLQPLTPSEQRVLDRQGGVISTATQEPEQPQQQPKPKRRNRNNQNGGQQQKANSASGEMPIAAAGQIPNQQQNGQNGGIGGGVGLGLGGGLGGVGGSTGTTGTTGANGTGTNGSTNAVVAALYGTAQNQSGNQSGSTSSQGNSNNKQRSRNNFTNSGVVGYVTIQSSVPLSQSNNGTNGSMGSTGTGTTGTNGVGTSGGVGTPAVGLGVNSTGGGVTPGIGVTGTGTGGIGTGTGVANSGGTTSGVGSALGSSGFGGGTSGASNQNVTVPGGAGGANPVTGNTGTQQGVNPQTGNTGNGTNNSNSNNGNNGNNNPSTVSAQVTGLPAGQYSLVVTQYGTCGDSAAVSTGPIAANLGTLQVSSNGYGTLSNQRVQYSPQAFVGRVVAVVSVTAPGVGSSALGQRSANSANTGSQNSNVTYGCGVFRTSNGNQPFTNGGAAANNPATTGSGMNGIGTGIGTTTGGGTVNGTGNGGGTGTTPVNGSPLPTGNGGGFNPLNGGAAGGAAGVGGARR